MIDGDMSSSGELIAQPDNVPAFPLLSKKDREFVLHELHARRIDPAHFVALVPQFE
jgi:hypothetical protein